MFNQYKYNNDYTKENYARLTVLIPKGAKRAVEEHIASQGYKSTSEYFKSLLARDMGVSDLSELVGGGAKWRMKKRADALFYDLRLYIAFGSCLM